MVGWGWKLGMGIGDGDKVVRSVGGERWEIKL